jgi:hypothetical protein
MHASFQASQFRVPPVLDGRIVDGRVMLTGLRERDRLRPALRAACSRLGLRVGAGFESLRGHVAAFSTRSRDRAPADASAR